MAPGGRARTIQKWVVGLVVGFALGATLGGAMSNIGAGMFLGLLLGAGFALIVDRPRKRDADGPERGH